MIQSRAGGCRNRNPSMAKPNLEREPVDKKESPPEAAAWGTWEELLLAHAVNRFGNNSWDSISSELRKRSSASILFTPKNCKQKFQELERRFSKSNGDGDGVDVDDGGENTAAAAVPWIEELRKLRVAELQRELQNFDTYISSLQLKVKRLTEESDNNGCGERKKKPDLGQNFDEIEIKNEDQANNNPPDLVISGEKQVPGVDESDRDNQSMNGSNGNLETGVEKSENESSPVGTVDEKRVEESCDRRPDANEPVKVEPGGGANREPESIAESKSDGTVKESSDVQSSASKSRKERSDRMRRGNSKADERENDDQSKNSIPVKSLPLIDTLQKVRKLGSAFFERRLDRQEKLKYKNLIREHIDFETLQTRLKEGWYSDGNNKFFRDLLLVVNNTCIFYSNESPESAAAIKLRQFILKEMTSNKKQKTDSKSSVKQTSSKPTTLPPKRAPELVPPMIVCRKRSSITSKASGSRKEQTMAMKANSDDEQGSEDSEVKSETKKKSLKKPIESEEKKRSAAKFLNRINENKKEEAPKRSSSGRQLKEPDSPAKKGVGRPPKKGAAPPSTVGKRNREVAESESPVLKKRSKR